MFSRLSAEPSEAELRALIDDGAPESKTLEYKRELPDSSNQGKVRFLKAVTSFANLAGGEVIYGMEAKDGVPMDLVPLPAATRDATLLRLEQLCADGVEPRMAGMTFHAVPIAAGGYVLVVRTPRSWNGPHRVTACGHSSFYSRNASGSYPLDVAQLRQAFNLSADTAARIRSFRADRLIAVGNRDAPVRLREGGLAVLHVIPLQAFATDTQYGLDALQAQNIPPLGTTGWNYRPTLEGWLSFRSDAENQSRGYALLFRNGVIEVVDVLSDAPRKAIASLSYEEEVLNALPHYFLALRKLGVSTPAYVFYGLIGVSGYAFAVSRARFLEEPEPLRSDSILMPEIIVDDWDAKPEPLMRPVFDQVWNAFGLMRSFNYDSDGAWVGR